MLLFFFCMRKHELFIQKKKSYNRESTNTSRENKTTNIYTPPSSMITCSTKSKWFSASVWCETRSFFWRFSILPSEQACMAILLEPESPARFCAYELQFWGFFPWALATLYKFPLIGLKRVLVGSFLGGGFLVGFGLDDFWASEGCIWKLRSIGFYSLLCHQGLLGSTWVHF